MSRDVRLEASWLEALQGEFEQDYMKELRGFLAEEKRTATVFPPGDEMFAAFDLAPLPQVRVVVLGQDPYHSVSHGAVPMATGLAFAAPAGAPALPPSLRNVLKEVAADGFKPAGASLEGWARQGVLLLNTVLTVYGGAANSHAGQGWERATDSIVRAVSRLAPACVFILWGLPAQKKKALVDARKHRVLEAPHPSPLSAHRGFFGCRHFSKANEYLREKGLAEIDWSAAA